MDPVKDFGSFSSLMAPALLSGKKSSQDYNSESNKNSIVEKESTSFNLEDSKLNTTYSTTLNTQVKNMNNTNGFKEESFLIKTDTYGMYSNLCSKYISGPIF